MSPERRAVAVEGLDGAAPGFPGGPALRGPQWVVVEVTSVFHQPLTQAGQGSVPVWLLWG